MSTIKPNKLPAIPPQRTNHIKKLLCTEWKLATSVIDSALVGYFNLYWSAGYYKDAVAKEVKSGHSGILYRDGRIFTIKYYKCTEADCLTLLPTAQIALSFRIPKHTLEGLHPTVLVSCNRSTLRSPHFQPHNRK